jgi:putative transposase
MRALAPAMARPTRNTSNGNTPTTARIYFVTTKASMGRRLLQSERNAMLLIDVLRSNVAQGKFQLNDFVVMPDHLHLLVTLPSEMTIERAMQLIKGGYSYRLKKEFGYTGEVWQRGFSDVRICDEESYLRHRAYIAQNPVKARLVKSAEEWPYCFNYLAKKKAQGLKPSSLASASGTTKVMP